MIKNIIVSLILLSSISHAELFEKGNLGLGVIVGGGSINVNRKTQNYTIAGVSAEYFVMNDLSVGFGYVGWFGATPSLNQITLPVNYYVPLSEKFRPYVGAFVRETFVSDGYDDYFSYGAKVGLAYTISKKSYIGVAWVNEFYDNSSIFKDSSTSYPEVTFAFSF
ncbi:hypothetical protein [Sulfurimonas sp.]|uniref:hypothetical protein n=1 Tax=Sulfurimonas sp. TaxID=2022749 RepID=UPI002AB14BFD|nr:hypothetical protein [Sulfurimonas sp.]